MNKLNNNFVKNRKHFSSDVILMQLCYGTFFPIFCNIYFYPQLAFVFHYLRDFYIVLDHVAAFCFSLFQKDLDTFAGF